MVDVIEEEDKESGNNSTQHSVHLSYKDTAESLADENIQVILPEGSQPSQNCLVKLHKLIDFVKRSFYSLKDKTLAANILHELQHYNKYLPSLEVLIRPIEWPDCSLIGEFLKKLRFSGDQFSQTHSVASSRMRKHKKHTSKRKKPRQSVIEQVFQISDRKRHLLDESMILIYSLYYQIKKQEKDFAKVLLDADKLSKGFVYVTEFKKAMEDLGVIITEEDLIVLAQLSDFIRRIESKNQEQEEVDVECLINIDYLRLAQIIDSARLKSSYKQFNFNCTVFEYLMFLGIEKTMEEKKKKLELLFRPNTLHDHEIFSQYLLQIYKSIHANVIKRIYIEVLMAEKSLQASTFAESFCYHLCQEGAVDTAILLNDKL